MSDNEKLEQIGRVLTHYQSAKVEVAHLAEKIRRVAQTYAEVAQFLQDESSKTARVRFIEGELCRVFTPANAEAIELLNEADLCKLLEERDQAINAVASFLKQLREFGITNVE